MSTLEPEPGTGGHSQRGGIVLWLLVGVGAVVLLVVAYLLLVLNWSYSDGERSGVMQKLSRKGWIVKTWEGELAMSTVPGVAPVIWSFSVRDAETAARISALLGRNVVVHYTEHLGVPTTLFGETRYFVDSVRVASAAPAPPPEM